MDKQRKLKKYQRKDYSQIVDFPVEIVGRDGVVRAYSFEESVRLYQRRIASAASRYDDLEVISAETGHCRRRIQQLRHSYFERHGWQAMGTIDGPARLAPELAGEIAAFLRRHAGADPEAAEQITFSNLGGGIDHIAWYLTVHDGQCEPRILYLHQFEAVEGSRARESWAEFLRILQNSQGVHGAEQLIASHQALDCALILTGRTSCSREGHEASFDPAEVFSAFRIPGDEADHFEEAVSAMRAGDLEKALSILDAVLAEQPDHRNAIMAAAAAADLLHRPQEAEMYARTGCRLHPLDPLLHQQFGLLLLRQGHLEEARKILDDALNLSPSLPVVRFMLVALELRARNPRRATRLLKEARLHGGWGTVEMEQAAEWLGRQMLWRRWGGIVGGLVLVAGIIAAVKGLLLGWIAAGLMVAAYGIARFLGRPKNNLPKSLRTHQRLLATLQYQEPPPESNPILH